MNIDIVQYRAVIGSFLPKYKKKQISRTNRNLSFKPFSYNIFEPSTSKLGISYKNIKKKLFSSKTTYNIKWILVIFVLFNSLVVQDVPPVRKCQSYVSNHSNNNKIYNASMKYGDNVFSKYDFSMLSNFY